MDSKLMPIYFAPLQGYTDDVYRRVHHAFVGGVECYYTPFMRIEGGGVRSKDLRDVDPKNNVGVPLVPQIIMRSLAEFQELVHVVEERGYREIDLNMGCPFPMQARHGRGCGLMTHVDVVRQLADEIARMTHLRFSVKMRLGWEQADEWKQVLPILNDLPLKRIVLHPRVGIQQYKGELDIPSFESFLQECRHPLIFNGEIRTIEAIRELAARYPDLAGIMIGRGLLARPSLAVEYASSAEWDWPTRKRLLLRMHNQLKEIYAGIVNSEEQLHGKLRLFWEYMEPELDKKAYKRLMKSGNMKNFMKAVEML
ncbi:MAG: tRNA-dihydrouridine synthase family protein [Parabacteroides sp.]